MRARLIVRYPDRPSHSCWLDSDGSVVGRHPDSDCCIDHPSISRRHALLHCGADGQWHVSDQGSKNGTFLQDQALREEQAVNAGDWLRFGDIYAEFCLVSDDMAAYDRALDRQLTDSVELQRALKPSLGIEGLVSKTLDAILELSGFERGFVLLHDDSGDWRIRAQRRIDAQRLREPAFSGSLGAVERCMAGRAPIVCCEIRPEHWLADRPSIIDAGIQALISLPLAVEDELLGVVYADKQQSGGLLSELDLDILESLTSHAALAIAVARLEERLARLDAGLPAPEAAEAESVILRFDVR